MTKTGYANPCKACERAWMNDTSKGHCYFWEHEPPVCNRFVPLPAMTPDDNRAVQAVIDALFDHKHSGHTQEAQS